MKNNKNSSFKLKWVFDYIDNANNDKENIKEDKTNDIALEQSEYAVEMIDICKSFLNGKIVANDHINLRVKQNEVHAIIGENGAGKSTLMSILSSKETTFLSSFTKSFMPILDTANIIYENAGTIISISSMSINW